MDTDEKQIDPAVTRYLESVLASHQITTGTLKDIKNAPKMIRRKRDKTRERNIAQNAYALSHWRVKA